jgi:hypothetical protein
MDDTVAYKLVTSTISTHRMATIVVKPDAADLVLRISQDSGSPTVAGLSVYWDKLASAIIMSIGGPLHKRCDHTRLCARCVSFFYEAFLDGIQLSRIDAVEIV